MTSKQIAEARKMRKKGYTLQEIGDEFGVTREWIRKCTEDIVVGRCQSKSFKGLKYPALAKRLKEVCYSYAALSEMIGVTPPTIHRWLYQKTDIPKSMIDKLLDITGLTYEEAFRQEG